jgi:two-component system LytT family response regulator
METAPLRAYLVDDEPLAIERLRRLLASAGGLRIAGSATDPAAALDFLNRESIDVLFLDIQMPGMNGFELLSRLNEQPFVIFTTAYDEYALKAFEVNSIDYLLKPIEPEQLARALKKLDRLRPRPAGLAAESRNCPRCSRSWPHRCAESGPSIRAASPRAWASAFRFWTWMPSRTL